VFGVIGVGKGKEDTGSGCAYTYPTPGRLSTAYGFARAQMCRSMQAAGAPVAVRGTLGGSLPVVDLTREAFTHRFPTRARSPKWCAFL
jgi:hypothetical protein